MEQVEKIANLLKKLKENPTEYNRDNLIFLLCEVTAYLLGKTETLAE